MSWGPCLALSDGFIPRAAQWGDGDPGFHEISHLRKRYSIHSNKEMSCT